MGRGCRLVESLPDHGCCNVISWQLMTFIVISLWVWSALIGGCSLPLIFVSESWSICRRPSKINDYFVNTIMNTLVHSSPQ